MNKKLPRTGLIELAALTFGRRRKRVIGPSMQSALYPNDVVLVDTSAYGRTSPQPGDIVVAELGDASVMVQDIIKRVHDVAEDGSCYLLGDNPEFSQDSRVYGRFESDQIVGRVTSLYSTTEDVKPHGDQSWRKMLPVSESDFLSGGEGLSPA